MDNLLFLHLAQRDQAKLSVGLEGCNTKAMTSFFFQKSKVVKNERFSKLRITKMDDSVT